MKQLTKKDLIEGEIYNFKRGINISFILKWSKDQICSNLDLTKHYYPSFHKKGIFSYHTYNIIKATPEEKHWLEECIKAYKFVSYDEAMKTFTQYYKISEDKIGWNYNNNVIREERIIFGHYNGNNRIIKTIETGKHRSDSIINILYGKIGEQEVCFDMSALQPSTKEAYDAQFITSKMLSETLAINDEGCVFKIGDKVTYFEDETQFNIVITNFKEKNGNILVNSNNININELSLVVDTFKLPKHWYIKLDETNVKVIGDWFNKNSQSAAQDFDHVNYFNNPVYSILAYPAGADNASDRPLHGFLQYTENKGDYKEITFEQFKKYVLNEKV